MSTSACAAESFDLLNAGAKSVWRGQGDTWTAARDRAAEKAGVTPAQAERLSKNWKHMKHPNGDVYRALRNTYGHLCEWVENKADTMERRRLGRTGNAVDQSAGEAGEGTMPRRRAGDQKEEGLK
jgi:hypothetical protein